MPRASALATGKCTNPCTADWTGIGLSVAATRLPAMREGEATAVLRRLATGRADRLTHVESVPARPGRTGEWPKWVPPEVLGQLADAGIEAPWIHQVATAQAAYEGRHVVVATGTASGKPLGSLLPAFPTLSIAQAASPHR